MDNAVESLFEDDPVIDGTFNPDNVPDLNDIVFRHAQRCHQLAQMTRPPGTSVTQWAIHLLPKDRIEIENRLMVLAEARAEGGPVTVPVVFDTVPPTMAAPVAQYRLAQTRDLVRTLIEEAIEPLSNRMPLREASGHTKHDLRDPQKLRTAANRAREVAARMPHPLGRRWAATVTMLKDGSFRVVVA